MTPQEQASYHRLVQPWHHRAFTYRDLLGEINYASKFYGRALRNVEFYAAEQDEQGDWVPTQNQDVIDAFERVQVASWVEQYGTLMFLTGEGLLFATHPEGDDLETWEFVSKDELRVLDSGRYQRIGAPGMLAEELRDAPEDASELMPEETVVYRLWTPHPRYSMIADSPMRSVLDICEEMVLLTQSIRARSLNRMAGNGWLLIPDQASFAEPEAIGEEDAEQDPFIRDLTEAMTAPTQDPGTSGSVVPLVTRMDGEWIEKVRHIIFQQEGQAPYPESQVRADSLKRLAIGLDMPPEILLGLADSNHWTAWQIDEQVWEAHILPITIRLCTDLSQKYLWPTLQGSVANPRAYQVAYDEAALVKRPDRSNDAKDLHDRGAINDRALREANAFDEDDMPTMQEPNTNPKVIIALARAALGGGPQEATGSPDETQAPPGPPDQPNEAPEDTASPALVAAASVALGRCREVAGNRIRNRFKASLPPEFADVPAGQLVAKLGNRGFDPSHKLVAGGAKCILEPLYDLGYSADAAICLQGAIERYAASTLYDERPAPIPLELLEEPCLA
jgi:hypothetical protein